MAPYQDEGCGPGPQRWPHVALGGHPCAGIDTHLPWPSRTPPAHRVEIDLDERVADPAQGMRVLHLVLPQELLGEPILLGVVEHPGVQYAGQHPGTGTSPPPVG